MCSPIGKRGRTPSVSLLNLFRGGLLGILDVILVDIGESKCDALRDGVVGVDVGELPIGVGLGGIQDDLGHDDSSDNVHGVGDSDGGSCQCGSKGDESLSGTHVGGDESILASEDGPVFDGELGLVAEALELDGVDSGVLLETRSHDAEVLYTLLDLCRLGDVHVLICPFCNFECHLIHSLMLNLKTFDSVETVYFSGSSPSRIINLLSMDLRTCVDRVALAL